MRLLLDTHAFIWWDSDPTKLSPRVMGLCEDASNVILLSVASVWEMQIKTQLGKMQLDKPLEEIIAHQQQTNQMQVLPIALGHVLALRRLPDHHRDPFDRLLIAQADVEGAALVSHDHVVAKYPVEVIW